MRGGPRTRRSRAPVSRRTLNCLVTALNIPLRGQSDKSHRRAKRDAYGSDLAFYV